MTLRTLVAAMVARLRRPARVVDLGSGQRWRLVRGRWRVETDRATPDEREDVIERYRRAGLL